MRRIIYVAGRYRHYNKDGSFNLTAMAAEVDAERYWTRVIAECGHMWFGPLLNSIHLEENPPISGDEFVERDKAVIRRFTPDYDGILMRGGWDMVLDLWNPPSYGAGEELDVAIDCNLLIAHTKHGEDMVREYLTSLND